MNALEQFQTYNATRQNVQTDDTLSKVNNPVFNTLLLLLLQLPYKNQPFTHKKLQSQQFSISSHLI
jgi:hypothetical protein